MNIIEKLLENPLDTSFDLKPLIHGSMNHKLPELELAIDGYITPEQAEKLKVIKQHYEDLGSRKDNLEKIILSLAASYTEEINLILIVPYFRTSFPPLLWFQKLVLIWTCFQQLSIYAPGQDLHPLIIRVLARKSR